MKKYVIIGNGVAAAGCIEGIRSVDRDGEITVVSEENHPVYCRPLISYYLEGKTKLENIGYRPADFYEKNNCRLLLGRRAQRLEPDEKKVYLDDGTILSWDSICVAAGSSPFVPPMAGLDSVENKFGFMTLDDALAVEKAVDGDKRVLIIGAGLIGLKCAEGILGRAKSVTVCDLADRVLSSILDAESAAIMQSHLEKCGIGFMLGDTATSFDKNTAHMKSGRDVEFDVLILAVGVRANSALVKDAGGDAGRGIVIDGRCAASLPDVYAAGDVARVLNKATGQHVVAGLWKEACVQGACAGRAMAAALQGEQPVGEARYDGFVPSNSITVGGAVVLSGGSMELSERRWMDVERRNGCVVATVREVASGSVSADETADAKSARLVGYNVFSDNADPATSLAYDEAAMLYRQMNA